MSLAASLVAEQIRDLQPYQSARRIGGEGKVYLNANEASYPPFEMPEGETWNRYPDFLPTDLAHTYARYAGTSPEQTLAVRGADEAIDLLVRTFCEPGNDTIRIQSPTYSMYEFVAEAHGVTVESVPLDQDFLLDANANLADAESSRLKLIFVCNPNNPTGGLMPLEAMRRLLDRFRENALVVVDEAYIEYCPDHSVVPLLAEYPNLVVIRTLSKAFALAAIRVGFLLARQDVLEQVNKLIAPYPMPDASARIALRALSSDGLAYMRGHCGLSIERRDHLREALLKVDGVDDIAASDTNFLLVRFSDAKRVMNSLKSAGIILRDQTHLARLPAHLRITVGSDEENAALLDHLQRLAARG